MAKLNNEWVLIGDVNPIEHGGMYLQMQEGDEDRVRFVQLMQDNDGTVIVHDGEVDLSDSWIEWTTVYGFYGWDEAGYDMSMKDIQPITPYQKAEAAVSYYGAYEFSADTKTFDYIEDEDETIGEVKKYLALFEIVVE